MLSHTVRLPVFGTLVPLLRGHLGRTGFNPIFCHVLAEASDLPQAQ